MVLFFILTINNYEDNLEIQQMTNNTDFKNQTEVVADKPVMTEVRRTSAGLAVLKDFHNLFGYSLNIPSLVVGENRKLTKEQLNEKYPNGMKYLENVKQLTKLIKTFGGKTDVESYKFRAHHIKGMNTFLNVVSRLQTIKVLDEQIQIYREEDVGWGLLEIKYEYKDNALVSCGVYLDDVKLDLSKPIKIQAINWEGELVSGIQIYNRNANETQRVLKRDEDGTLVRDPETGDAVYENGILPISPTIQISDDDLGNLAHYEKRYNDYGAVNKSDVQLTMQTSPLDYMVVRIVDDEKDEDLYITGFATPLFLHVDFNYEIPYLDHIKALEMYNDLKDNDLDYNARHFAGINLFRWGSLDKATWDRGLKIFNAVLNSPKLKEDGVDTLVDSKVVMWANANIESLRAAKKDAAGIQIDDNAIVASNAICLQASVLSRSYFITKALVVTDIEKDDVGFRDARIAFKSRPSVSNKFQSIKRSPTDLYKIVELDDKDNIIGIVNPVDIFAIVQYATESVVVEFKSEFIKSESGKSDELVKGNNEVTVNRDHAAFYSAIGNYTA